MMRTISVAARITVSIVFTSAVYAQSPSPISLQEQLVAQYKLVKMGSDSSGTAVVEPGTLLVIQRGGILGVPWNTMTVCPAKFQDNSLHSPGGICSAMVRSVSKYFQAGEKVYATKVEVNVGKSKVEFAVVACDSCNGTNPPTSFKGEVVFQFPKGYLEQANAATVEDTIGHVFSITNDGQQQAQGGQPSSQEKQPLEGQSQTQTQTIELGQTIEQVQSILGEPEKVVNLGAKQIYIYKDLKVTFVNGKVSDVQ